jgi:hypothetical protein
MQAAFASTVLSLPIAATALVPQANSEDTVVAPACKIVEGPSGTHTVFAACGSNGLLLGTVDAYRSSYNAELGSLAVELIAGRTKRVLLISRGNDGTMHVDDLTRELTKLSGRYGDAGLEGVDVDLTGVPASGVVRVPIRQLARAAEGKAGRPTTSGPAMLDLRPYSARGRAAAP